MQDKGISDIEERKVWQRFSQMVLAGMIVSNPPPDDLFSGQPVWPTGIPQDVDVEEESGDRGKLYVYRNGRFQKL